MKIKIILVFIILILLITNVNAFCLFRTIGNCNKVVAFNPVFSYEDKGLLEKMNLREIVEYKSNIMTKLMPVKLIGITLPLRINVNVYDGQSFTIVINKEGKVVVFDKIENTDIIIYGYENELKNLFMIEIYDELISKVEETNVEPVTFKGKLIMQIIEDYFNIKIVKDKSNTQKVMDIFTIPIVGIVKLFS